MLNSVIQTCRGYYNDIPVDTFQKVVKSALYSFTATSLLSGWKRDVLVNLTPPLFAAGIAALASLVYALTTPLFNAIFENNKIEFRQELVKDFCQLPISCVIINYLATGKASLSAMHIVGIASLTWNLLASVFDIIPSLWDAFGEPRVARKTRWMLSLLGLAVVPGSSSICLNFGRFPTF